MPHCNTRRRGGYKKTSKKTKNVRKNKTVKRSSYRKNSSMKKNIRKNKTIKKGCYKNNAYNTCATNCLATHYCSSPCSWKKSQENADLCESTCKSHIRRTPSGVAPN